MKGTKYMAKGGGMKGTKYKAMGGGMKSTKGFAKGGAALRSEMKANPGMGNMPKSVKSAVRRKRAKKQGVGGKPTNVKTFAAKGGMIINRPSMGLFGRR